MNQGVPIRDIQNPNTKPPSCWTIGCVGIIGLWAFSGIVGSISSSLNKDKPKVSSLVNNENAKDENKSSETSSNSVSLGKIGYLILDPDAPYVPVMRTREALNEMTKCIVRKDNEGLAQLYLEGKMLEVETRCPVKVLESGGFLSGVYRIRILGGKNYGRDGWVHYECVKPSK